MRNNFQVLSNVLLDRVLEVSPMNLRSKSASTPPAQSSTLLHGRPDPPGQSLGSELIMERIKNESKAMYNLINFMSATGCRISEALQIKPTDITSMGLVKIRATKGSKNRLVSGGLSENYLKYCYACKLSPWGDFNRFFVYRYFKKHGIGLEVGEQKNKKVTHAFRHMVAQSIKNAGMKKTDSQQMLGHKNIKSTEHYHNG